MTPFSKVASNRLLKNVPKHDLTELADHSKGNLYTYHLRRKGQSTE